MKQKITLDELKNIFVLLMESAKKWGIKEIYFDVNDNYYFKIPHKYREINNAEFLNCPDYSINFLDEDIVALKDLLKENDPATVSTLDFEKLGAVMIALGATFYKHRS